MRIALIDPFFDTSHKKWAEGLQRHSSHEIDIYSGSPHHWKWKMTGGTLPLVSSIHNSNKNYDLFLATDMLNIPLFKSMLNSRYSQAPFMMYFHENQVTYPWSPNDRDKVEKRDHHYGFINYCSALISAKVFFNSKYHMDSFLGSLEGFMKRFPEDSFYEGIEKIKSKSQVLPLGSELPAYTPAERHSPVFIWNHRWEYDKNPELFFNTLFQLKEKNIYFKLIVVGKSFEKSPPVFKMAKNKLSEHIIHFGYAESKEEYQYLLSQANVLFVTSNQDFFGISIVEAIAAGCYPVLPDRLAYSEHIHPDFHSQVFYKNEADLEEILTRVISENKFERTKQFSDYVKKYEWERLKCLYDVSMQIGSL